MFRYWEIPKTQGGGPPLGFWEKIFMIDFNSFLCKKYRKKDRSEKYTTVVEKFPKRKGGGPLVFGKKYFSKGPPLEKF